VVILPIASGQRVIEIHENEIENEWSQVPYRRNRHANEKENATTQQTQCDNLILSDSILRRIQTNKFTPNAKTIERFIRGGATTCANFVNKYGHTLNAKNVLIHVGTRDIQTDGVKATEFTSLLDTCTKTLGNAKIYVSLMTRRRDIPDQEISTVNRLEVDVVPIDSMQLSGV
jgi:hypothetical protein